jgi:hypothetical protein
VRKNLSFEGFRNGGDERERSQATATVMCTEEDVRTRRHEYRIPFILFLVNKIIIKKERIVVCF